MKAGNVWAVALLAALQVPVAMARPPNVVLLIGDDVGYSDLGAYGGEIDTPNLDALATAGTLFTNYHTTASCSPTRAMLMTGVDNHRNGLGNMDIVMPAEHKGKPGYDGVLNDRVVTIAQRLRDNGYHTYHIGKWHLGNAPEKRAYNRGFERTISLGDTGADNWEQRSYLPFYDKAHWYADGAEHQLPDDFYSSRYFVDKAIEFIDENHADGQPFFANIGFQAVHIPIQAPAEFVDKYVDRYDVGWHAIRQQRRDRAVERGLIPPEAEFATMSSTEDWDSLSARDRAYNARKMAVYAGMLEAMDFHVGRLIDYLKRIGEYENTVFIFLSDNGAEPSDPLAFRTMAAWVNFNYSIALEDLGSKGSYAAIGPSWASAAVSPGAYFKFWAGEGGVRVPLIVSWPGQLAGGQVQKALTHVKDIAPTILELTNTPVTGDVYQQKIVEPITGVSLGALLRREITEVHPADKPIGYELAGNAAVYKGDYKLLRNLPPLGDGEWHLYDISKDPGEVHDLRERMPERYAAMLADYAAYARENGVLEMPEGYDYIQQTYRNGQKMLLRRWWPALLAALAAALLLVGGGVHLIRRPRRPAV